MTNRTGTYYKGKTGRRTRKRIYQNGNGKKYVSVRTYGRTRIKTA